MTMSVKITADQFDAHGRVTRQVEIHVNIPSDGQAVAMHVQNLPRGRMVSYSIPRAEWDKMCAVVPHESGNDHRGK